MTDSFFTYPIDTYTTKLLNGKFMIHRQQCRETNIRGPNSDSRQATYLVMLCFCSIEHRPASIVHSHLIIPIQQNATFTSLNKTHVKHMMSSQLLIPETNIRKITTARPNWSMLKPRQHTEPFYTWESLLTRTHPMTTRPSKYYICIWLCDGPALYNNKM